MKLNLLDFLYIRKVHKEKNKKKIPLIKKKVSKNNTIKISLNCI